MKMNAHNVNTSTPELSRRVITARTVNEELRILEAKCAKAKRRLDRQEAENVSNLEAGNKVAWNIGCRRIDILSSVLDQHIRNLDLAIAAALAGKTYRHR